jgi:hypothetical protein
MRGGDEAEAAFGALVLANALANLELIAKAFKKEPELPPLMPGEEA